MFNIYLLVRLANIDGCDGPTALEDVLDGAILPPAFKCDSLWFL